MLRKSYASMAQMKAMQPEIAAIRRATATTASAASMVASAPLQLAGEQSRDHAGHRSVIRIRRGTSLPLGLFPGCAGDEVRNTPLDIRIEEGIVEIVRARGCGIVKQDLGQRW